MAKPGIDSKNLKPSAVLDPNAAALSVISKLTWSQLTADQKDLLMMVIAERFHLVLKQT